MKLIHTSDIHLDSPLSARFSPIQARERRRELTLTLRSMIDEAVTIGAKGIIIAGDFFDNDRVSARTIDTVMGFIEKEKGLTFYYLPGNHEKDRLTASGVKIPDNLKIFGEEWTYFDLGDGVTLCGRSKITQNMFDSLSLSGNGVNILTLHGELADRTDAPDKIGLGELEKFPVNYLALGHYHSFSETKIGDGGVAVYCGTPEGRGFDEAGDKGYVIVDVDESGVIYRFVKRAMRTVHIIPVDISGAERYMDIENRISDKLVGINRADVVRIVLTGKYEVGLRRDTESLTARFSSSYYYFEVKDESRLKISIDDYKNDKSLKGEFIRLVLSKEGLSQNDKEAIIECGLRALSGETI